MVFSTLVEPHTAQDTCLALDRVSKADESLNQDSKLCPFEHFKAYLIIGSSLFLHTPNGIYDVLMTIFPVLSPSRGMLG